MLTTGYWLQKKPPLTDTTSGTASTLTQSSYNLKDTRINRWTLKTNISSIHWSHIQLRHFNQFWHIEQHNKYTSYKSDTLCSSHNQALKNFIHFRIKISHDSVGFSLSICILLNTGYCWEQSKCACSTHKLLLTPCSEYGVKSMELVQVCLC